MPRPSVRGRLCLAAASLVALWTVSAAAATEGWGLFCADLDPRESVHHGAVVTQVLPGSAAARGGIRAGDIVTSYAGRGIASVGELDAAIAAHPRGGALRLGILRAGSTVELLLGEGAPPAVPDVPRSPQEQDALAALRAGEWSRAEMLARTALAAAPQHAELWNLIGEAQHNQQRTEDAMLAYREALRLEPDLPSANVNLGELMLSRGLREEARPHFERAAAGDPQGHVGELARQRLAGLDMGRALRGQGPGFAARPDGLKALVDVASFEVPAPGVPAGVGAGLREMLVTALHGSGYFIVMESGEVQARQLAGERASGPTGPSLAGPAVADIRVTAAVAHFDPRAAGSAFATPIMGSPFGVIGSRISVSQVTIEISVVDAHSGQLLARQAIPGMARSVRGIVTGALPGAAMPSSLDVYRNTPLELALRDCMQKAAYFVANNIPEAFFAHR